MCPYEPGSFKELAETELGMNLWAFFREPASITLMIKATLDNRPALEGLQKKLLDRFGEEIREDRCKQMMGNMVRQVMEHVSFQHEEYGVNITTGDLFTSASRYRLIP